MDSRDRDMLERAVRSIAERAAKTTNLIDEAMKAGQAADRSPRHGRGEMLRLALLKTKAE